MQEKMALSGATEVWLCDDNGTLRFFTSPGTEIKISALFPGFPTVI
jgi:hypothetical protein